MIDGSERPDPDLVELDLFGGASRPDLGRPALSRPDGHIRSPILERRSAAAPVPRHDPPGIDLPPLRALLGAMAWVLVPALPVLAQVDWQAAVVMGVIALTVREAHLRADRSTISFADGFVSHSGRDEWPHGVQEDDDVRWNWSSTRAARPEKRASG